ncbi:sterol 3-beta-glucosyltransferase, partial [Striga asiatica]
MDRRKITPPPISSPRRHKSQHPSTATSSSLSREPSARNPCSPSSANRRREILFHSLCEQIRRELLSSPRPPRTLEHLRPSRGELLFLPASHNSLHTDVTSPPATALVRIEPRPRRLTEPPQVLAEPRRGKPRSVNNLRQRECSGNRHSTLRPPLQRLAGSEQQPSSRGDSSSSGREQRATGLQQFEELSQNREPASLAFVHFLFETLKRPESTNEPLLSYKNLFHFRTTSPAQPLHDLRSPQTTLSAPHDLRHHPVATSPALHDLAGSARPRRSSAASHRKKRLYGWKLVIVGVRKPVKSIASFLKRCLPR